MLKMESPLHNAVTLTEPQDSHPASGKVQGHNENEQRH